MNSYFRQTIYFQLKLLIGLGLTAGIQTVSGATQKYSEVNLNAPKGGAFIINIEGEPANLHPVMAADYYSSMVHEYTFAPLADRNLNTYAWEPVLADKWEVAKDQMSVVVTLRSGLLFHDGKPITAEDVKFSFDAVNEPSFNAAHLRPYYEGIASIEILSPSTLKFIFKDRYFRNLTTVLSQQIFPKHVYGDLSRTKKLAREIVGSGPYEMKAFDKGQRIVLSLAPTWHSDKIPSQKGFYNFATVIMRFTQDKKVALEMSKKGELDYNSLKAEAFFTETEGPMWGKTVFKHQVENRSPKQTSFIGWNLRNPLFADKQVRLALYHLINRTEMNKKFRYNMSSLANGPAYIGNESNDPSVKAVDYNPKRAKELLAKAGWSDSDKDGILDKQLEGKKVDFKFAISYPNPEWERYLTMYLEDLKQVGIVMELRLLEWSTFSKNLDTFDFQAINMAWSGNVDYDLKQIWHSTSIGGGGSNFIGYKNSEVDRLIDEARVEAKDKDRIAKTRKAFKMIAEDYPYAFLFNDKYAFLATSNRIQMPGPTFQFGVGTTAWWSQKIAP